MAKFQFEKKQVLPAIGMGVASVGLFAYFVLKMTSPPPLQAAPPNAQAITRGAPAQGSTPGPNAIAGAAGIPSDPLAAIDPAIAAPTDSMRDPFAPQIVDNGTAPAHPIRVAANPDDQPSLPGIPKGLPPIGSSVPPMNPGSLPGSLPPIGSAPSGPQWTVTGVLSDDSEPHNSVAIFRSGDARRFVRLGDMVDGTYRLIDVNRSGVVIADGSHHIHLPLGGYKKTVSNHVPVTNGAATGPWTGTPASAQATPASGQPAPVLAPAQTPAAVPGPEQAAPTGGLL